MSEVKQDSPTPNEQASEPKWERPAYRPNYVDLDTRAVCLAGSALLICYAVLSLINDDFFIWLPARRGTGYIHLHGTPIWIACAAVFCACLSMLSIIVDHHDTRDNEQKYKKFAKVSLKIAWVLLILAMVADATYFHTGTARFERNWPFN